MRPVFTILAATCVSLLGVAAAHAGTLASATLTLTTPYQTFFIDGRGATGSSTSTTAALDAGSAFSTARPWAVPAPSTTDWLTVRRNGAIAATPSAVATTAPITGRLTIRANGVLTLITVPLKIGAAATFSGYAFPFSPPAAVTLINNGWHVGQTRMASPGITRVILPTTGGFVSTAAQTHLTATGSFDLTPGGAGTVILVTIRHVIVSGEAGYDGNTAAPTYLTLIYAAPEPGTLLLLAASATGLALAGRRKRRP